MQTFEHTPEAVTLIESDILDKFYPPTAYDALDCLVGEFDRIKARICEVHQIISQEHVCGVMGYFFEGNAGEHGSATSLRYIRSFEELFQLDGALYELTAKYWDKALRQTDLLEIMPQARRTEWHTILNAWRAGDYKPGANPELDMPEFNLDNLRSTIGYLNGRKSQFLAERVDGIFQGLSRTHVTNAPEGFAKRMIMSRVYNEWGSTCSSLSGVIHDLRIVIAKFMGRDDPCRTSTERLLQTARATHGEWIESDAGALRVRGYKVGTAHLELHPEMACRLNSILAYLHPAAIPEAFRKRPKPRKNNSSDFKSRPLFERPFSNAVAGVLASMEPYKRIVKSESYRREYDRIPVPNAVNARYSSTERSKHLLAEVATVMQALGGVLTTCSDTPRISYWQFDFNALDMIHEVATLGYIPDQKAYQFYPTPEPVAQQLVDWLDIGQMDTICEPQAGQGGIADLLPKDRTRCVEISALHCEILRKKGHNVTEADFLSWNPGDQFSVIAMNPPYSEGRWQAHLQHAGTLIADGGRLGAVLPMSAKKSAGDLLPGFDLEFSEPIDNAFAGTSISVVLLKATKR